MIILKSLFLTKNSTIFYLNFKTRIIIIIKLLIKIIEINKITKIVKNIKSFDNEI